MVSRIREELMKAFSDKKVKGVILRINSPGGSVTASDIIYREIKKFKDAKQVPVVACLLDVAASGAYYISLAADSVIAHPSTITGSIVVIAWESMAYYVAPWFHSQFFAAPGFGFVPRDRAGWPGGTRQKAYIHVQARRPPSMAGVPWS